MEGMSAQEKHLSERIDQLCALVATLTERVDHLGMASGLDVAALQRRVDELNAGLAVKRAAEKQNPDVLGRIDPRIVEISEGERSLRLAPPIGAEGQTGHVAESTVS